MSKEKFYTLRVDDHIVYEKTYQVKAHSIKEAREKFKSGDWFDAQQDDLFNYLAKSVIKKVEVDK